MATFDYNYDIETSIKLDLTGFKLSKQMPLDLRAVVNTLAERDEHITTGRAYPGMLVFVTGPDAAATTASPVGVTYRLDSFDTSTNVGTWSIVADRSYVDSKVAEGGGIVLVASESELDESTGNSSKLYITKDTKLSYLFDSSAAAGSKYKKLNADKANQLATARTVSFAGGDVTGSFSFDGSADVSNVDLTIADGSVTNAMLAGGIAMSKVTDLETNLAAKLDDDQLVTTWSTEVSDSNIPSEKLVSTSLADKVDKVDGKGLSTNDFTDALQTKLNGIADGAQVNVLEGVAVKHNGSTSFVDLTITDKKAQLDISNYALKEEIAGALKYKGGKTGAELNALTASDVETGWFYTCTEKYPETNPTFKANYEYAAYVSGSTLTWTELGHFIDVDKFVLKTQKVNGNELTGDITLHGAQIKLDNYAKGSSSAAIVGTDTINAAFGKVENQVDGVQSNLTSHAADTDIHVTAVKQAAWNAKYDKPAAGIGEDDLSSTVNASLDLADSALQKDDIATGSTNGTISVDGDDVAVKGLGTAAYKAEGDFATAAQGALADTAVQPTDTVITNKELLSNKITEWSQTASADKYPAESLVKTALDGKVDKVTGKGLSTKDFTEAYESKLNGISAGATKTETSTTNGNIKIDGSEATVYTHPADKTAHAEGFYKITNDTEGHVTAATAVVKSDITGVVGAVTTTANDLGLMTAADKSKLDGIKSGANKVEASETNGNIKIDGSETTVYTHPSTTAVAAAFKKVGNDAAGHVVLGDAVAKSDITSVVGAVTTDTNDLGLMTAADKTKLNGIAEGAQVNVIESLKVNGTDAIITSKAASVTLPNASTTGSGLMTAEQVTALNAATTAQHTHSNKALLDTYDQTNADITAAVAATHSHDNKTVLDGITSTKVSNWDSAKTIADKLDGAITVDGSVKKQIDDAKTAILGEAGYAQTVKSAYTLACGKVGSVATGSTNGTIAVDGTDVAVAGLDSAAYTKSTDYATAAQGAKADTAVQSITTGTTNGTIKVDGTEVSVAGLGTAAYAALVNNITTTTAGSALDASQGKALADRIENLEARGRYLSVWYCDTGLPADDPTASPYTYKSGDYYVVGRVAASGSTNYKPDGSSYTKRVASTTVETSTNIAVGDYYLYDGTVWRLLENTTKTITIAQVTGLQTALDSKVVNTREINGHALSEDVTLHGGEIKLDGYTKAEASAAIAATDSVNAALGKLEYKIDNATTGTVTSVGLSMPSIFTVSGSPVTASGTLSASLNTQAKNKVFAGPATGDAAAPTFRELDAADIPSLTAAKISDFSTEVAKVKVASASAADTATSADKVANALTIKKSASESDTFDGSAVKTIDLSVYLKSADQVVKQVDTSGVLALDANGQLSADVSGKMDKDTDSSTGNVAKFDASHNAVDAGFAASDVLLVGNTFIMQCDLNVVE